MFEKFKGMADQFQMVQKMMQDEDFKAFISHPKIQALFKDPEFREVVKTKDFAKILSNPNFAELMKDPEVAALVAKLNPQKFMQNK